MGHGAVSMCALPLTHGVFVDREDGVWDKTVCGKAGGRDANRKQEGKGYDGNTTVDGRVEAVATWQQGQGCAHFERRIKGYICVYTLETIRGFVRGSGMAIVCVGRGIFRVAPWLHRQYRLERKDGHVA
jgi:hypothetical protein